MKILHTVEFYSPSVGGAQEVIRQISEHLVQKGHSVTVATSKLASRHSCCINGVNIEQFEIRGNAVSGISGEIGRYQDFLINSNFDIMLNYAAQQWAADSVFPVLSRIQYKRVFIPCGFSALYNPAYAEYFAQMPGILRQYDHIIFHASRYRDIDFARQHGITNWSIIPNGALQTEFENPNSGFRQRFDIPAEVPILLTIGTHTGIKGRHFILETFRRMNTPRAVLVIIGNASASIKLWDTTIRPLLGAVKKMDVPRLTNRLRQLAFGGIGPGCLPECRMLVRDINRQLKPDKRVLLLDLPRAEVVTALQAADLFVFGSNVEYSPIVLFEAMASHTPFLTLACGNAAEIVEWSNGGGMLAPTIQKEQGFVDGDPKLFAKIVDALLADPARLKAMGEAGYSSWKEKFTWGKIAAQYEALYQSL